MIHRMLSIEGLASPDITCTVSGCFIIRKEHSFLVIKPEWHIILKIMTLTIVFQRLTISAGRKYHDLV